jgi:hypothetical protein
VYAVAWSPDGKRAVSGDDAGVFWIYSVEK